MTPARGALRSFPLGLALLCACRASGGEGALASGVAPPWREYAADPVIRLGDAVPAMVWNDPAVLKEAGGYRMWLSGGDPRDRDHIVVQVYEARSANGLAWRISPTPVLPVGGEPGAWDGLRVETPSVVKVGATYHLYYSGADEARTRAGVFAIGHAISTDGVVFVKDPANPVVRGQEQDRFRWGYGGVGEPGIAYDPRSETFYLYYAGMRFSREDPPSGHAGILLATSKDGSRFESVADARGERVAVLAREPPHPAPGAWFGYSAPAALFASDGLVHLFCDLLVAPRGPTSARQLALVHAVSRDGLRFELAEDAFVQSGRGDWKDDQVRAPSVVESDGRLQMWFAAQTRRPRYAPGIGYAWRPLR